MEQVWIESIRLQNAQSIGDVTYNLARGKINVIAGANDAGKSVLFKLVGISFCKDFYDKTRYHELINWNASQAIVTYELSDKYYGGCVVTPKNVLYFYYKPPERLTLLNSPSEEFVRKCGIIVSNEHRFIPNILDTVQAKLLVDPKLKQNIEFLSMAVLHEGLDKLAEDSLYRINQFTPALRQLDYKILDIVGQLSTCQYVDVNSLKRSIELRELLYDSVYTLVDAHDSLESLEVTHYNERHLELLDDIEILNDLEFPIIMDTYSEVEEYILDSFEVLTSLDLPEVQEYDFIEEELLQDLENLTSIELPVVDSFNEVELDLVDALLILENIELPQVMSWSDSNMEILDSLFILNSTFYSLLEVEASALENRELSPQIADAQEELYSYKIIYGCPIYGKVVHDGEICVPYNT